jgi:hypothetical protein
MTTLEEALRSGADVSYLPVRCAALFYSIYLYAGETALGEETAARYVQAVETLLRLAAVVRTFSGTPPEVASQQVMQEANRIADLYIERYQANYAARGLPFSPDPIWDADVAVCRRLTESD